MKHILPEYITKETAIDGHSSSYLRKQKQTTSLKEHFKNNTVPFKSAHSFKDCLQGFFEYLVRVGVEDQRVFYEYKGKQGFVQLKAPKEVIVSKNLWRSYSCLQLGCSKCCHGHGFVNLFSENEYNIFSEKYDTTDTYDSFDVEINNKSYKMYIYDHRKSLCQHLDTDINGCSVHELNPIHCAFPLMKFKMVKDKTYVTREMFGRNWAMKCPAVFHPMTDVAIKYTFELLYRVKNIAKEYNIETRIDEIIHLVNFKNNQLRF